MATNTTEMFASIHALPADLMFASRIRAAADAAGASVGLYRKPELLLEATRLHNPRLVLVDLDARGWDATDVIRSIKSDPRTASVPVVAFVSHVREDAIAAAHAAQADHVLPRSAFVRMLPELIAAATASPE